MVKSEYALELKVAQQTEQIAVLEQIQLDDANAKRELMHELDQLEAQNRELREKMTTLAEQWERVRLLSDSAFGDRTSRAEIDLVKSAHERCSKQLRAALAPIGQQGT